MVHVQFIEYVNKNEDKTKKETTTLIKITQQFRQHIFSRR